MARLRLWALGVCSVLLVVVGFTTTGTATTAERAPSTTPTDSTAATPRVPLVTAAPDMVPQIGIASDVDVGHGAEMNELVRAGVGRAAALFDAEVIESTAKPGETDADREARLTQLAEADYYPIIAVGSAYAGPLARVAPKFPRTWFEIVDDGSVDAPNVIGILFRVQEGAYLVGAAAALTSTTGTLGFIGAEGDAASQRYEAGFTAGAKAVRPDATVQVAYLAPPVADARSADPGEARKTALRMAGDGVEVIFAADGDASDEVIQVAAERGFWAIGVDGDRYQTSDPSVRGAVLTSMLKRVDNATNAVTLEIANGVRKDGNHVFGLDRDGVGYATSGGFVDPIRSQLDALAAKIASGEVLVPTKP